MRSRYGVTWFCALIQREKGGFTSVFRDGVKVHSRQVFEPLCDTNTRGRARAVGGGEGTDGRRVFPGVFVGSTCGVSTVFNGEFGRVRS